MPLVPLPPHSAHYSWDDLVEIMARLRMGCPWDREQTHRTLVPYLIEETFEVVEAIEISHLEGLCEELGDLLLQVLFHAQLAHGGRKVQHRRRDRRALQQDGAPPSPRLRRCASSKTSTRSGATGSGSKPWKRPAAAARSRLDGIPKHLGALQRGQRMQEKAARVGFDWPDVAGILDKARGGGAASSPKRAARSKTIRACAKSSATSSSRWSTSRARSASTPRRAMREANEKFYRRFAFMEARAEENGKALSDLSLQELEELWQLAKT